MKVSLKRNFKFSHKKDGTKLSNAISGITGCPCRAGIQYVYLHIYIHIYSCWSLIHVCKSIRGGGFFGTGPSTWRDNSPQLGEYQTHILSSFHTNILVQQSPLSYYTTPQFLCTKCMYNVYFSPEIPPSHMYFYTLVSLY